MKITVLIENTSIDNFISEHGLSFLIEYEDMRILLDAGTTDAFMRNADKMGVDLTNLDFAVLSHGHYDHSGGFEALFERNKNVKVYARKEAFGTFLSGSGGEIHEIGIPNNVLKYRERFAEENGAEGIDGAEEVSGATEVAEGVFLIPHNTPDLYKIGEKSRLYRKEGETVFPDDFVHEQSLVFDTEKGLIIFNSCSHGGVENIIREVKEACRKKVYAYVGGFHMKGKANGQEVCAFSKEEVDRLCNAIKEQGIEFIYTGHCTGEQGLLELQKRLGTVIYPLTTGMFFWL